MSDREFIPVKIAVLTVSDTRTLDVDKSGNTLVKRLEAAGHILADRAIIRDERDQVADKLRAWVADEGVDVVISTGGTGLTGRDVTVEAHRDVYEKEIEAFGTLFTMIFSENRHVGHSIPRMCWRGGRDLPFCAARLTRGV